VSVRALETRYEVCRRTLLSGALFALVAVLGSAVQAQTAPLVPGLLPAAQPSAPADIIQGDGRGTPSAPSTAQPTPQTRAGDRGVLVPPPSADPGLKMPPPSGSAMPVIPPPITPGVTHAFGRCRFTACAGEAGVPSLTRFSPALETLTASLMPTAVIPTTIMIVIPPRHAARSGRNTNERQNSQKLFRHKVSHPILRVGNGMPFRALWLRATHQKWRKRV